MSSSQEPITRLAESPFRLTTVRGGKEAAFPATGSNFHIKLLYLGACEAMELKKRITNCIIVN
jgi:hypothetical protein